MLIVARSHKTAPYTLANQQIAWSYGKEKGSNKTNERHPAPSTPEGGATEFIRAETDDTC